MRTLIQIYSWTETQPLPEVNYLRFMAIYQIELIYRTNMIEKVEAGISRHVVCMYEHLDCTVVNRSSAGENRKIITALVLRNTKVNVRRGGVC